ncbi:MAG: MATE family efflux transporter, partial [Evtepia sp.]
MKTEPDMLGTMPMGKLIARMSIPLMVSMLIQSMYNIVDSIFVSKLGQEAISAMGIAFPVQMLMIALANGLGVGMNALISQRFGRGQTRDAARAAGNTLCLSAVLTLVFMIFGYFGTEAYFKACATDPKIIAFGVDYLRIVCIGCVGIFFVIMSERLLQVTGKTALSMTTQLSGAVINIILDPILIFGLFGFPKLGIAGAAIATVVGQIFAAIFGYILHLIYNHSLQLHCSDLRISRDILTIVQVGLPASVTMAMGSISTFGINKILQASVVSVSVVTVFFRLQSFLFMPLQGMMQGLIPIIGFNYGAKSGKRLQEAIHIGVKVS